MLPTRDRPPSTAPLGDPAAPPTTAPPGTTPEGLPPEGTRALPALIGRYRIIALLGEGGMGTVYEAEQPMPRRRVALKMMRHGAAGLDERRRFAREAQALARLQHPGIAQIYEAGTVDGPQGPQPYFAMELVAGRPLTRHAAALRSVQERVALLAALCDAVHYAHQRGVIHRDLKPANVLVDGTGQPKVLDFGIARLTDADLAGTHATIAGEVVGTLQYMSPEQLAGDPQAVDLRCDVYALGVVLYEVLAGRPPYALAGRQLLDVVRVVTAEDPRPLGEVDRRLRGDLEVIVDKALAKDPDRRYASAAGLAADLRRYLHDEPITARPASASYQLRKLARRHRAAAGGAAIAVLALVGGTGVSTLMALRARAAQRVAEARGTEAQRARADAEGRRREALDARAVAEQQRGMALAGQRAADSARALALRERALALASADRAARQGAKAEAVSDFLERMLRSADPNVAQGREISVRAVLDEAGREVARGSLRGEPEAEARVRLALGTAYENLTSLDSARAQYEAAHALLTRARGASSAEVADAAAALGDVLRVAGDYPGARRRVEEALAIRRRLAPRGDDHQVRLLSQLAAIRTNEGRPAEAEAIQREALALARRLHPGAHAVVVRALQGRAEQLAFSERVAQAEPLYREALAMGEVVYAADDPALTSIQLNAGHNLGRLGRYAEAETLVRRAIATQRKVYGDNPRQLANGYARLGTILRRQGRLPEAEPVLRETLAMRTAVHGPAHGDVQFSRVELGIVLEQQGRTAEAESLFVLAHAGRLALLGPRHPAVGASLYDLARMAASRGDPRAAARHALAGMEIFRGAQVPTMVLQGAVHAGRAMVAEGRPAAADSVLRAELARSGETLAPGALATALEGLADVALARGQPAEADSLLRRALAVRRSSPAPTGVVTTLGRLADVQLRRADTSAAVATLADADATLRGLPASPDVARARRLVVDRLVVLHEASGRAAEAAAWRARRPEE